MEEREVAGEGGGSVFDHPFWFYLLSFWGIYIEEAFARFFPLGFSQDKYLCSFLCGCACLAFSDLLAYGYVVMMLNVLRTYITIKIQHGTRVALKEYTVQLQKIGLLNFWVSLHNPSAKEG